MASILMFSPFLPSFPHHPARKEKAPDPGGRDEDCRHMHVCMYVYMRSKYDNAAAAAAADDGGVYSRHTTQPPRAT